MCREGKDKTMFGQRPRVGLKAVYDEDLERVLDRVGILEDVRAGRSRCAACSKPVDLENLGTLFSRDGEIQVSCDSPICIHRIAVSVREAQTTR